MMHRLFVALRPPSHIRAQLLSLVGGVSGARWQRDDQLHLTVRFIGEVDRQMAEDVALALSGVRSEAIEAQLSAVGMFGEGSHSPSLWAGVSPQEQLSALHRKVDHLLARNGLPPEGRAFVPHVTIARLNRKSGPADHWLASHAGLSSTPFRMEELILFESELTRDGAFYRPVLEVALGELK